MDFSNGYMAVSYPGNGGIINNSWDMNVLDKNTSEVFVEFDARMPGIKHGLEFLKISGEEINGEYSAVTFGLDSTGEDDGGLLSVSFGDGSSAVNNTGCSIKLDGTNPESAGRSYSKTAHLLAPCKKSFSSAEWGNSWHHFRIYWKFDTAEAPEEELNDAVANHGKANGVCFLEIDGVSYVIASGLLNRHFSNSLKIKSVSLAGQTLNNGSAFAVEYDNIKVSTGGF